ncbi:hypothetical protein DH2020_026373 [Rehmannia glutinosa]|uniref:Trafficking protein particle complex subunit 8-like protein n=1 Tax=Rehmannia glutinosa TaxID=99300 RepID=A0ABR0W0M6_REHGL
MKKFSRPFASPTSTAQMQHTRSAANRPNWPVTQSSVQIKDYGRLLYQSGPNSRSMADPANTKLGRMLLDEITPVVMVLRTPLVEESCRKNGLSLIEMLTPYSNFNNIDVPVRTASDQPYRLRKFKLRLFYDSEIRQPNIEAAKERLKQVITRAGDKDFSGQCSDPPDIESLVATSQQEFVPSWFQNFNKELVDAVSFSEHEAFDHPVAYYELALSNYRLISTDYKLDKAWKHYAGVQEMMGLAYFMLDQSRKDAEYCMENAFTTYLKIGSSGGRNVTRCGIWWAEMLKARGQFKDAAGVYFRISGEEPLHSAVMLEQASYCFLSSTPTMLRKYGFHLVLSGDLYKKSDQETGKTFEVFRLQLPVINFPSIKIVFEDHRIYASPSAAIVRESLWQSLEGDMIPSLSAMKTNWLDSKVLPKKYKESNVCVAGGMKVQLTVTPKIEGTLKLVGVRWKLSASVIGICNFHSDIIRKKVAKGKRKPKQVKDNLQFLVIKSLPRLEGVVDDLPKTVYAGELRRLTLELRNPSKISVKNLKMRISHPRFLNIAAQEVMNSEFPTCLRKQENSSQSCTQMDAAKATNSVFVFPETTANSWETPLKWPLWFRAAAAGSISLYMTIYYEMKDGSSVITYRTLRMHYNLEVLPSLEVSLQTSPCPSRLQEFLVRMDVVNRTSSESFLVHQLSCVGDQWELALLRPIDSAVSFELLMAGQAMSCFFKLKYGRRQGSTEEKISSLATSGRADVRLVDSDSEGCLIRPFHLSIFFTIMKDCTKKDTNRIASNSPIWWLMDGPRSVRHDFSAAFCEINLSMTVYNSSEDVVSVRINTLDSTSAINSASVSGNDVGWHDTSHLNEIKVTSDVMGTRFGKALSPESVSPFIWSGSSSTRFNLEPLSSVVVPLQISVFSPGTFDLSNYSLHWNLVTSSDGGDDDEHGSRVSSGTCQGHSYHITVLQKE